MTLRLLVRRLAFAAATFAATLAGGALAQSSGQLAPVQIEEDLQAPQGPETLAIDSQRVNPPPLGAEMFIVPLSVEMEPPSARGAEASIRAGVIDPGHVLRPGDQMHITLWGLVDEEQDLTVDPQGNVLVPGVGPVHVEGLTAAQAPAVVTAAARRIYSNGVQIYATATGAAPTQVLVTGPVERPGAYNGASSDSLIVFLQKAGGISAERGSYRRVRIVRNGQTLATADLYEFLRAGAAPAISFRSGDAIVVEEQGAAIAVTGDVRSTYTFELSAETGLGSEVMRYARPRPGATHVAVVGVRNAQPFSTYLTLAAFATFELQDGDRVQFVSDVRNAEALVRIEGAHSGPSVFSVPRGTTVGQILQQVSLDADADRAAIHLRRDSVRSTQKQLLNQSLDRLERATLLAPARSPGEAASRTASSASVIAFVARARSVEPLGILALNGHDPDLVRVETGDVIVIPPASQIVSIAGEVEAPQSILAHPSGNTGQYVRLAGGFTRRADRSHILVFRQDGQIREGSRVEPGDRVLVPTKPDSTQLPFIRDLTQTIFQVAGVLIAIDRD